MPDQRESRNLGRERDSIRQPPNEQWLLAKLVPRQDKPAPQAVDECECEHSGEAGEAVQPPSFISRKKHLGIAAPAKALAFALQLTSQLDVVVDLAVVGKPQILVSGRHWLCPGWAGIEDCEPPVRDDE